MHQSPLRFHFFFSGIHELLQVIQAFLSEVRRILLLNNLAQFSSFFSFTYFSRLFNSLFSIFLNIFIITSLLISIYKSFILSSSSFYSSSLPHLINFSSFKLSIIQLYNLAILPPLIMSRFTQLPPD